MQLTTLQGNHKESMEQLGDKSQQVAMLKTEMSRLNQQNQVITDEVSRLLFLSAEMFKKPLWQTVWTQIGAVCSGSTLFASILNLSVMLGNYLQQTTSADDIFRCIFFLTL